MPPASPQLPPKLRHLKIALVHDYLREYGGAERVLEALHNLFPSAPVYVAFFDQTALGGHWARFVDWDLRETWLTKIPGIKKLFSPLRFLAPKAFADLDLSAYDLVISSSNAYFAKAVRVPNGQQVCYCHTPPRALYGYTTMSDWKKNPVIRIGGEILNHYLRIMDFQVAQKVEHFIANSQETARRIQKFYRRDSVVICPPVIVGGENNSEKSKKNQSESSYYLYVNRLALSKHPEIAVAACLELNVPLRIVGAGPMLAGLQDQVVNWQENHPNQTAPIQFLGAIDDAELNRQYQHAQALIYPVEDEDFGMVPVEAMLAGVPVIAHNSGGPKETVIPGLSGIVFDDLSVDGVIKAIHQFQTQHFSAEKIKAHAQQFDLEHFNTKIIEFLTKQL